MSRDTTIDTAALRALAEDFTQSPEPGEYELVPAMAYVRAMRSVLALCDEVDRLRADLEVGGAEWSRLAEEHDPLAGKAAAAAVWEERARRAEAALDRVRTLCDAQGDYVMVHALRGAIDRL